MKEEKEGRKEGEGNVRREEANQDNEEKCQGHATLGSHSCWQWKLSPSDTWWINEKESAGF